MSSLIPPVFIVTTIIEAFLAWTKFRDFQNVVWLFNTENILYIEWNLLEKSVKRPFCCTVSILQHCKLTRRRRSNSIDFTVRLCDPVAPLVLILRISVRKANLYGYISQIQNIFVLFNSSAIRGIMINNIWDFILTRILL